ncbi:zinc finger, CCHC-type containing protein [Tanacetum coccineum]
MATAVAGHHDVRGHGASPGTVHQRKCSAGDMAPPIPAGVAIFDENRFSSVPRPSQRSLINGTEDIGGLVVFEEITEEVVVQKPEPELRKSKRNRTPKNFGTEFQLYLIEGTRDVVSDQHSYCFNVENDPKTFDEAMKSQGCCKPLGCKWIFKRKLVVDGTIEKFKARLVIQGFRQKSRIDYFDTYAPVTPDKCVYSKFDESGKGVIICQYVDDMLIFGTDQVQVDMTKEFLSSRFSIKDMGEADVILGIRIKHESNGIAIYQSHYIEKVLKKFNYFDCTTVSTPMDTSEKMMLNNGQTVSQLEYSRVIGCLMYAMTYTRSNIAFAVGKLNSNTKDNSSISGWVFLLGGGAISWVSKKQTCITSSIIEIEFIALEAGGKEAELLRNLILEIPLWSKPIAPISIRCDSAATLAKADSQMYNGKSRHLGVRHSMIRDLITNGVVFIEFVRSQGNLADHLANILVRNLVLKSDEGMGLKSNYVTE